MKPGKERMMNPGKEETTLEELLTRLAELEREHAHLEEVNTQLAEEVASPVSTIRLFGRTIFQNTSTFPLIVI
jgi:predicted nuclease with TOPRIM domain